MFSATIVRRTAPRAYQCAARVRRSINTSAAQETQEKTWKYAGIALVGVSAAFWAISSNCSPSIDAEAPKTSSTIALLEQPIFEEKRRRGSTKEENRDLISSQHQQVKDSWENPGVYAWGLNTGKVVAPESNERWVKSPRRIPFFDGVLLRDLKLDKNFGAAISEQGDLLQWGVAYAKGIKEPEITLRGKDLKSLAISDDRVIALSNSGIVYSIPVSKTLQQDDPKLRESSWFWSSGKTNVAARNLTPTSLGMGEKVTQISGGLEHVLMLTSKGRVFSAASSSLDYPKHGQLGVPGLTWYNRPNGPFDQPHELKGLQGVKIKEVAAGDTHSLALDIKGRAYSFGDNSHGQLGFDLSAEGLNLDNPLNISPMVLDIPAQIPIERLYASNENPKVTAIGAGGTNSYFVVDSTPVQARRGMTINSDTLACGRGIWGSLGTGKWQHIAYQPTRIPTLSGLFEYNERTGKTVPIRVGSFNVGQTHVAAILDNITEVAIDAKHGENETNWGADVFFFGNNENFQIGDGKRANRNIPGYIQPLGAAPTTSKDQQIHRFQLTPGKKIVLNGRSTFVEQRVECGRSVTAVYSASV